MLCGTGRSHSAKPRTSSGAQFARRRASRARVGSVGRLGFDDSHVSVVARRRSRASRIREHIQTVRISIPQAAVPEFQRVVRMQNDIMDRLAAIPGVAIRRLRAPAAVAAQRPERAVLARGQAGRRTYRTRVPLHVAAVLRDFGNADRRRPRSRVVRPLRHAQVAVISENVARREWGSAAAALGKRLRRGPTEPLDRDRRRRRRHPPQRHRPTRARHDLPDVERVSRAILEPRRVLLHPQRARRHGRLSRRDRAGSLVRERQLAARQRADARRSLCIGRWRGRR